MKTFDDEMESIYQRLSNTIHGIQKTDQLLLVGDCKDQVGRNNMDQQWGEHGMANENSNGLLLVNLCIEENVHNANTLYRQQATKPPTLKIGT